MFKDRIARLWGQRFRRVIKASYELCAALQWLTGRSLARIFNVGKELFLIFDHPTMNEAEGNDVLRVHFGINGYARVTDAGVELRSHREPFVVLEFDKLRVHFRAKVKVVSHTYALSIERRMPRDVNAEEFAYKDVIARLRRHRGTVSDAIMDQNLLPGVGNVIKCEALFAAKIHPLKRTGSIKVPQLRQLVEELRWFANWWYQNPMCDPDLRASGNSKIYGYDMCSACCNKVALIKNGKTSLPRLTYYCPVCQADDSVEDPLVHLLKHDPCESGDGEQSLQIHAPHCNCGCMTVLYASHRMVSAGPLLEDRVSVQLKHMSQRAATSVEERPVCVESSDFGRLRFVCQHGFMGGCGYQSWADLQLPHCNCGNGRHAALRRVLGVNEHHGKYFACCGMSYDRGARCKYFRWVRVPSLVAWHQPSECIITEQTPIITSPETTERGSAALSICSSTRRWHRSGHSQQYPYAAIPDVQDLTHGISDDLECSACQEETAISRRWRRSAAIGNNTL